MRLAAACILGLVALAAAADADAQGLEYGVKGGVTLADLQAGGDAEAGSFDFRVGFAVGGFVALPLGGRLEFQPEALYVQKGAKSDELGGTSTEKLDYLDVPLLVSYRIKGSRERNIAVFGGPSVGVRLRARSNASFSGGSFEEDVSDQVKSTEFAAVAGLAYHRGRLVVDGRYSWGFTDIDKETGDGVEIRNRVILFLAGWRF
jgi:outer membrane immunogenic protein